MRPYSLISTVLLIFCAIDTDASCHKHPVHAEWPCAKHTHIHLPGWKTLTISHASEKVCIWRNSQGCMREVINPHNHHGCKYFGPLGQGCGNPHLKGHPLRDLEWDGKCDCSTVDPAAPYHP